MATGVVLYHYSQGQQAKAAARLSLRPSTTADVMGQQKGLTGGPSNDVPLLQGRIRDLQEREINLVVVMQVMLIRRLLPCKRRPLHLWEFNPEGPRALQHFMGTTPVEMYKLFFRSQEMCPELTEDSGLSCNRPDTQVSCSESGRSIYLLF